MKNNNKILFSIIIPTYKKPKDLKLAIVSVLNQSLKEFELIVIDDASRDNTKKTVKSFKDKHIVYIENKVNIGVALNIKKGFKMAKGKYVFLLGDDDIILRKDTLSAVYNEMENSDAGYSQLGYIYFENNMRKPSFINNPYNSIIYFSPSKDILIKTLNLHFGSMSGSIFRKKLIKQSDIINNIWWIYFIALYKSLFSHGCLYIGNHFILAKISRIGNISYVDIKKNKGFYLNQLLEIYKKFDSSPKRRSLFLKSRLDIIVDTLPGIKYYSSTKNIIQIIKETIELHKDYIFEFKFLFNVFIAIFCPKIMLSILRKIRIFVGSYQIRGYLKKINFDTYIEDFMYNVAANN